MKPDSLDSPPAHGAAAPAADDGRDAADRRLVWLYRLAVFYLVAALFFVWGFAAAHYKVFPWALMHEVKAFVAGHPDEDTGLMDKVLTDAGLIPGRAIRSFVPAEPELFREIDLPGARDRRAAPRLYVAPGAPASYRVLSGAFDWDDALWGAILLDPEGRVIHGWKMSTRPAELSDEPDDLMNLYGLSFQPDGSAIFTLQERGGGIVKVDACSNVLWAKPGEFHHTISPTEDHKAVWTMSGLQSDLHPVLELLDAGTGETLKSIDIADVARANPTVAIFDLQRRAAPEATHANDVEPLPASLAAAFPMFAPGDLLISYQATNLIYVLDPETLKVKWWRLGAADGPHDPDWGKDGRITLFDNVYRAERRGVPSFSTIVSIDPRTYQHRTLVDGKDYNFYSQYNGHHLVTDYGSVLITSSIQGRFFEVDPASGKVLFDFVNAYDWDSGETLHVSEGFLIHPDTHSQGTGSAAPAPPRRPRSRADVPPAQQSRDRHHTWQTH